MAIHLLNSIKLFLIMVLAAMVVSYANAGPASLTKIVFFGDSLTDNGNMFHYSSGMAPKSPPYYQGRFTNGKVWSEQVQSYFSAQKITALNFAVGGETALQGDLPFNLAESVSEYLTLSSQDYAHTLYIIWVGGNDYLEGATDVNALTTHVTNSIYDAIKRLIAKGANNFLVLNLPNLAKSPYAHDSAKENVLYQLSTLHNQKLSEGITGLQQAYPAVNIHILDIYTHLNNLLTNPDSFNKQYHLTIKNLADACWSGGITLAKRPITTQHTNNVVANTANPAIMTAIAVNEKYSSGLLPCNHPEQYVYWDRLHPSAVTHIILARLAIDYVKQNYDMLR